MRKRFLKLSALCLSAGISFAGISVTGLAAESPKDTDVIGTLGFAQCSEYLNVRSSAEKEADVVGKLYNNGSAEILDVDDNGWYHIRSGNVDGYVSSEYMATGAQAQEIAATTGYTTAEVGAITLNVRAKANDTSEVVGSASESEELEVVAEDGDWVKVVLPDGVYGYVSTEYVHVSTEYPTAVTLEEEQAAYQQPEEAPGFQDDTPENTEDAYTEDAEDSDPSGNDWANAEETVENETPENDSTENGQAAADDGYTDTAADGTSADTVSDSGYTDTSADGGYANTASADGYTNAGANGSSADAASGNASADSTPATDSSAAADIGSGSGSADSSAAADTGSVSASATGQEIANYACQFVGNPYVWGGTSLTNGADCSGFVLSVFANYGISLPHDAASQAGYGTEVSYSDLQPGDLLFYSEGGGISHVAIYVGGGSIVHAANAASGICYSNADYSTPVSCRRLV